MRPKIVFASMAVLASVALFAVWPWLFQAVRFPTAILLAALKPLGAGVPTPASESQSHFIIPALAVIVSARGATLGRKASFFAGTALAFALVDPLARSVNVAVFRLGLSQLTELSLLAYFTITFAFSLVAVVLFLEGRPELLWEPAQSPAAERLPACPLCGKRKTNLAAHVKDAHGERMLLDRRVRRALGS